MSETNGGAADAEAIQAESDRRQFELLYQRAFEVRRRLGLKEGLHVFDINHPDYYRVQICANAYDSMYVLLQSKVEDLARSVRDNPYTLERWHSISINKSGDLIYGATDLLKYASRWSEEGTETDSELDTDDATYDLTEPLPDKVRCLLGDMNEILPTVTMEEYNHDESYEDFDENRYDRTKQRELKELEKALSTAGGALYLMQLALYGRYKEQSRDCSSIVLPKSSSHSVYTISAEGDVIPGAEASSWQPDTILATKNSLGSLIRTYAGEFKHISGHTFYVIDDQIIYEVDDYFEQADGFKTWLDNYKARFNSDEKLPDDVLDIVKHLLKAIVTAPIVEES